MQVLPSAKSLERLAGAVMCDQDEAWSDARYFSAARMAELYDAPDGTPAEGEVTQERFAEWQIVARGAIEASLELADELEAA